MVALLVALLLSVVTLALFLAASDEGPSRPRRVIWCCDCRSRLRRRATLPPRCAHCDTLEANLLATEGLPGDSTLETRQLVADALASRDLPTLRYVVRLARARERKRA